MSSAIASVDGTESSSKGKGKEKAPPPMRGPSTGSANPSASFSALWNYIVPALHHILRGQAHTPTRAPAVDVAYHMGIHTAVYNYFTATGRFSVDAFAPPLSPSERRLGSTSPNSGSHGADLYEKLDRYYADLCQELLASAPPDDSALIDYILPCFSRYAAGARSVARLLHYINRHYVKRAVEEDRGWLRYSDVLDAETLATALEADKRKLAAMLTGVSTGRSPRSNGGSSAREQINEKYRERRIEELGKWGYIEGSAQHTLARAEAAAEAASPLDRVVPLVSMAFRRYREDVIRPLIAAPKGKKKKKKTQLPSDGNNNLPRARLARAVKELIESTDDDTEEERRRKAVELNEMLFTVGIPPDQPLRKKLSKFGTQPLP